MLWAIAGVVLAAGISVGALVAFTDLTNVALSGEDLAWVVVPIAAPLLVVLGVAAVRAVQRRALVAYLRDFGLEPSDAGVLGTIGGVRVLVRPTRVELDFGWSDVWSVDIFSERDLPRAYVGRARESVPVDAEKLPPIGGFPPDLAARATEPIPPQLVTGLRGFVQLRSHKRAARVLLSRPLDDPRDLRRAIRSLAQLAGTPFPSRDDPSEGPTDLHLLPRQPAYLAFVAWFVALLGVGFVSPDAEGYEAFILERARSCDLAKEVLGEPIERRVFGWQWSGQANRRITSTILVRGPRAEGSITVTAYKRTRGTDPRDYPMISAVLEAPRGPMELLSCARDPRTGIQAPRTWRGRAGVNPCEVSATPTEKGDFFECRVEVSCGGTKRYGATPETGFTDCWTVGGKVVARDPDRGRARPEPTLDLDERRSRVVLGDGLEIELLDD